MPDHQTAQSLWSNLALIRTGVQDLAPKRKVQTYSLVVKLVPVEYKDYFK